MDKNSDNERNNSVKTEQDDAEEGEATDRDVAAKRNVGKNEEQSGGKTKTSKKRRRSSRTPSRSPSVKSPSRKKRRTKTSTSPVTPSPSVSCLPPTTPPKDLTFHGLIPQTPRQPGPSPAPSSTFSEVSLPSPLKIVLDEEEAPLAERGRKGKQKLRPLRKIHVPSRIKKNKAVSQLDSLIAKKADSLGLPVGKVRAILRHLVAHDGVFSLVQRALTKEGQQVEEEESETSEEGATVDEECQPEPKFLRSKTRAMEVRPKSVLDEEFPEEEGSSDSEYEPEEPSMSDVDSETTQHSILSEEPPESPDFLLDETGQFKVPRAPSTTPGKAKVESESEEDLIATRTRSKAPMTSHTIEQLEAQFIPPDISQDMYEDPWEVEEDDPYWKDFLKEFATQQRTDVREEEEDEEYRPPPISEDEEDNEERRNDNAVKISRRELNDLIQGLFDGIDYDATLIGDISAASEPGPEEIQSVIAKLEATSPKSSALVTDVVESEEILLQGTELSQMSPPVPEVQEPPLPLFSPEMRKVLHQQLRMHVQLLGTSHVLANVSHRPEPSVAQKAASMLNDLGVFLRGGMKSLKRVYNLPSALRLVQLADLPVPAEDTRPASNMVSLLTPAVSVILGSPAFPYPSLFPKRDFSTLERKTANFSVHDDFLIASGLQRTWGEVAKAFKKRLRIRECIRRLQPVLMPWRSSREIVNRIANVKARANEGNPIKVFLRTGTLAPPPLPPLLPCHPGQTALDFKIKDVPPAWRFFVNRKIRENGYTKRNLEYWKMLSVRRKAKSSPSSKKKRRPRRSRLSFHRSPKDTNKTSSSGVFSGVRILSMPILSPTKGPVRNILAVFDSYGDVIEDVKISAVPLEDPIVQDLKEEILSQIKQEPEEDEVDIGPSISGVGFSTTWGDRLVVGKQEFITWPVTVETGQCGNEAEMEEVLEGMQRTSLQQEERMETDDIRREERMETDDIREKETGSPTVEKDSSRPSHLERRSASSEAKAHDSGNEATPSPTVAPEPTVARPPTVANPPTVASPAIETSPPTAAIPPTVTIHPTVASLPTLANSPTVTSSAIVASLPSGISPPTVASPAIVASLPSGVSPPTVASPAIVASIPSVASPPTVASPAIVASIPSVASPPTVASPAIAASIPSVASPPTVASGATVANASTVPSGEAVSSAATVASPPTVASPSTIAPPSTRVGVSTRSSNLTAQPSTSAASEKSSTTGSRRRRPGHSKKSEETTPHQEEAASAHSASSSPDLDKLAVIREASVREKLENEFVEAFLKVARDTLGGPKEQRYRDLVKHLMAISEEVGENLRFEFDQACNILQDLPDLRADLLLFLSPDQAHELDVWADFQESRQIQDFLIGVSAYFADQPVQIHRIRSVMCNLVAKGVTNASEIRSTLLPLCRGSAYLADKVNRHICGRGSPPPELSGSPQELSLPEDQTALSRMAGDEFETFRLPPERCAYGTPACPCQCHSCKDPSYEGRQQHCVDCGIQFIQGKPYLRSGRQLKAVRVAYAPDKAGASSIPTTSSSAKDHQASS